MQNEILTSVFDFYQTTTQYLYSLNEIFQNHLVNRPRQYCLLDRGLSTDVLSEFNIGYCSSSLKTYNIPFPDSADRITFPIFNMKGDVVGFSARIWKKDDTRCKYVNSYTSSVFKKSYVLYGLYQTYSFIQKEGFVFVVEGNIDVLTLYEYGVCNVVAGSGTSFSVFQLLLLKYFTSNIVFCYDSDEAGQKAFQRVLKLAKPLSLSISSCIIQDAKDPDEYIRKFGRDAFLNLSRR